MALLIARLRLQILVRREIYTKSWRGTEPGGLENVSVIFKPLQELFFRRRKERDVDKM